MAKTLCLIGVSLFSFLMFRNVFSMDDNVKVLPKGKNDTALSSTILITYDNNPQDSRLKTSWGFSCLLRYEQKFILFDTGENITILLENMEKLQIDPCEINIAVISHIHGDHKGGLTGLLKKNNRLAVYLPLSFPIAFKDEVRSYGVIVEEVSAPREIIPGVYTTGELGNGIKEQALIARTPKGLVIITGCAHPGIVRIVSASKELLQENKVYLLLGGFHLGGSSESQIQSIIKSLISLGVENIAPCHCTGETAINLFQKSFGKNYIKAGVGTNISIP